MRILSPPALFSDKAVLIVRGSRQGAENGSAEEGNRNVQAIQKINQSIRVIKTLSEFAPPGALNLSEANAQLAPAWEAHIQDFFSSTGNNNIANVQNSKPSEQEPEEDQDSAFARRKFQGRTDLDFTERFWESVLVQAKSFSQVVRALQKLVQALSDGHLLPYIHKSNDTLLGKMCRQAIQRHVAKARGQAQEQDEDGGAKALETYVAVFSAAELTPKAQRYVVENLLQLGGYALEREFAFRFGELGISKEMLADVSPPGQNSLERFQTLSRTCKLVWTALTFRCPTNQAKALALASLRYAASSCSQVDATPSEQVPTFLLSLDNTQLPWVSDEAAGVSALPVARFWQLLQRERAGQVSQLCRVSSDGNQPPRARCSLSPGAARKVLEMCDSEEPADLINAFVSREYHQGDLEACAATHNMNWIGLVSRRVPI
jgi:hypothetical protein